VFWVISVYFNIRNTLPKYDTFLLGHPVYYILLLLTANGFMPGGSVYEPSCSVKGKEFLFLEKNSAA
jgi:hypothetical protein